MAKAESEHEALKQFNKLLQDPRSDVYLLLLDLGGAPVSKQDIAKQLQLERRNLDRALEWLYKHQLIERLPVITASGKESFFYALLA